MKRWLALLLLPSLAFAAKTPVSWTRPMANTDGTPLTDLAGYRVEWGECATNTFPYSVSVGPAATSYVVVSSGIAKLCIRVFSINANGAESDPSNVAQKRISTLGKPQTLGQPVTLP